ncbi:uncharacterized protein TRUGW13939_01889, partial [Talaromyces rugulosus]
STFKIHVWSMPGLVVWLDWVQETTRQDCSQDMGPTVELAIIAFTRRQFSSPATFPTEEEGHSRRIDVLGHQFSHQGASTSATGLPYSSSPGSGLQDAPFPPNSGLLMSGATSSTGSYHPGYTSDVTLPETIIPTPSSIYSQPSFSWNDRMPGYQSNPRIPALLPSADLSRPLGGHGTPISNGTTVIGRDNYPEAYALSSRPYQSPAGVNNMSHYPYNSSMPSSLGTPLESSNSMYSTSSYGHSYPSTQPEAPPFRETTMHHQVINDSSQPVQLSIQAKIHKGFFQVEEKWTCYRRNYFSVTCFFNMQPWDPNSTYYTQQGPGQHHERIRDFAMSISAVVSGSDNDIRELVQHSPKRDKQSEKKPDRIILQPHCPNVLSSNAGPSGSVFGIPQSTGSMPFDCNSQYAMPLNTQPPMQHTFERIQFQKATANNGKRRAQQQYYNLVVELWANVSKNTEKWVLIATKHSDEMVVRGRSPGHYKDSRRDSSASMGDSGGGSGGDPGQTLLPPQNPMRQQSYAQTPFMPYDSRRGDSHYTAGNGTTASSTTSHHRQRRIDSVGGHSPDGMSPLMSSSSSLSPFDLVFSEPMEGTDSTDGLSTSHYHDGRKKSSSTLSNQSHMCLDLNSHSHSQEDVPRAFEDIFDPMVASYQSEKDDGQQQQYLKRQLAPLTHDSSAARAGAGSYPRFDPVQNSLRA